MDTIPVFQRCANRLLFRRTRRNRYFDKLTACVEEGVTDAFLTILLNLMSLALLIDPKYRRNIRDFEAQYIFKDKTGRVYVTAVFKNNKMRVRQKKADNPNLTLIFKDGASLFKLLLSGSPDILSALLNQEVDFTGNINYLNKFAYMAMHLWLTVTGKLAA
ncbi:MAG: SCP2 sterol-binding domain-containing protein [Oscillospiraceae bacterium]|jgi:hypothetical protein|nr:SCP2 sterol-binding domain-containing protein [Oscillospiraceae bacterium]